MVQVETVGSKSNDLKEIENESYLCMKSYKKTKQATIPTNLWGILAVNVKYHT